MTDPHDIIIRPLITEEATSAWEEKVYTFEVARKANKIEIRKAVEAIFGVQVKSVRTSHVRGKLRRQGKSQGYTRSWKKARVALTEESKPIEILI